jgi:histidinol dehydrogenase
MSAALRRLVLADLDAAARAALLRRAEGEIEDARETVRPIIGAIAREGDAALIQHVQRLDSPAVTLATLEVGADEIATARRRIAPDLLAALVHAHANIRRAHEAQRTEPIRMIEVEPGVMAGERIAPIGRVGLYVPRGKGAFPSVMLMLATPAAVAGVGEIVVVTPPAPDGTIDDATLVAADLAGVHRLFRMGGAQAIAALALGTATVPRVDKLMGPCNAYGSAAKRLLAGTVDVGMLAGPSEAILLVDETADPDLAAADLLVEAEHGPDSAALLVTHDQALANAVADRLPSLIAALPEPRRGFCATGLGHHGGILLTRDLADSIAFANAYAPEHLLLVVRDPWAVVPRLTAAGEILIGEATPIPLGNFAIGVNAVLPTGGFARSQSATSIRDFEKRTSLAMVSREGFGRLHRTVTTLADAEGFPAHAAAVRVRARRWGLA